MASEVVLRRKEPHAFLAPVLIIANPLPGHWVQGVNVSEQADHIYIVPCFTSVVHIDSNCVDIRHLTCVLQSVSLGSIMNLPITHTDKP